MKRFFLWIAISALFSAAAYAQPAAPATNNGTPASVTATCKDGTTYSGTTMKGACRGHGGVEKKAPAKETAPTATKSGANAAMAPAAGGGAGKVWVNEASKVYHCEGDKYYGKTKQGEYMSEADAKAKGFHPDHGKACKS